MAYGMIKRLYQASSAVVLMLGLTFATPAAALLITLDGPAAPDVDSSLPTDVVLSSAISGIITDLNVRVELEGTGADAPWLYWDELDISLSHGADTVVLSTGTFGPQLGLFNVTFDDAAATAFVDFALDDALGTHSPEGLLSDFNGSDLLGDWTLSFNDLSGFDGDGDQLVSWQIFATVADVPPTPPSIPEPASLALFGLGLLGLRLTRRQKNLH